MTLYQFLIENESIINTLQKQGILPCTIVGYIEIYKDGLDEQIKGKSKTDSYLDVADKRKISDRTVITAVVKMQSEI